MGSSGSGRIGDYPGSSPENKNGDGGGAGGAGGDDRCARAFNVQLEDIEQSEFYTTTNALPPVGTQLRIALKKRLVAETLQGQIVGNLPTSHNYLAACIKAGWTYVGNVQGTTSGPPVAAIAADFAATAPQ